MGVGLQTVECSVHWGEEYNSSVRQYWWIWSHLGSTSNQETHSLKKTYLKLSRKSAKSLRVYLHNFLKNIQLTNQIPISRKMAPAHKGRWHRTTRRTRQGLILDILNTQWIMVISWHNTVHQITSLIHCSCYMTLFLTTGLGKMNNPKTQKLHNQSFSQ